jgi:two-component system alkaline phosphatase synthesis response regulator PhoP
MRETILIVEDEKDIVRMLEYNLGKEGFRVSSVHTGEAAIASAHKQHPDLIILDLMLPGMDGLDVCREIKKESKTASIPVIMLTAKSQESDKIVGLEMGADDYVTKPFSPLELIARIRAVLRRTREKERSPEALRIGDLTVDLSRISVAVKGKAVNLTAKEFELLKALILAGGRVLSRERLLDTIWGVDHAVDIQTRTIDVHIRTLRMKLRTEAKRIVTARNYGYRFDRDA